MEFATNDAQILESALTLLDADYKSDVSAAVDSKSVQKANETLDAMREKYGEVFINNYIADRRRDRATL